MMRIFCVLNIVVCSFVAQIHGTRTHEIQKHKPLNSTILSHDYIVALEAGDVIALETFLSDESHRKRIINGIDPIEDGETALMKATARDHSQIVGLLIRHGADPDVRDAYLRTAVMIGSSLARKTALIELLQHPNFTPKPLSSALVIKDGSNSVLALESSSIDLRDKLGRSALLWACYAGNFNEAEILLQHGADVNLGDHDMRTPLMWAATSSRGLSIVRLLLEKGADVALRDKYGATALQWAIEGGKKEIAELIAYRLYEPKHMQLQN